MGFFQTRDELQKKRDNGFMEIDERFLNPVYKVYRIPISKIRINDYNPNKVAPKELKLLEQSILVDGYTMPFVCYYVKEKDYYEIVDGYNGYLVMKEIS